MLQSIIIPHRKRLARLSLCLWSIARSAEHCRTNPNDYEILVVDNGSKNLPWMPDGVRLIADRSDMPVFNKPHLLNLGIEQAQGNVLTFIDADALVGIDWMNNAQLLMYEPSITRLCYRVRTLPDTLIPALSDKARRDEVIAYAFRHWFDHPIDHEAYGEPSATNKLEGAVFGNSQFSIRRDVLETVRCNEEYVGRGYEDLCFIRDIAYHVHPNYKGVLIEEADNAMFNIDNGNGGPDWWVPVFCDRNVKRYNASRRPELETTWGK